MPLTVDQRRAAVRHLRKGDIVLKSVIDDVGPYSLQLQRDRFHTLLRSIVSQQISVAAARTIMGRVGELAGAARPTAAQIARFSVDELRTAGLSRQKASYVLDLAQKTLDGTLHLNRLGRLSDEGVIAELTQVKGIGRWSAQMFLIFSLGRPDILPHDDLGIRAAMRDLYSLAELPKRGDCDTIAAPWRPYASAACWYLWRSIDLRRQR